MPQFTPNWARIKWMDLGEAFLGAQKMNSMKLANQRRQQEIDQNARQEAIADKLRKAQQAYFQASDEQKDARLADVGALSSERAAQIQGMQAKKNEELRREQEHKINQSKKNYDLKEEQNLRGAQEMQQWLPNVVQPTPGGPQIDLKNLFLAQQKFQALAKDEQIDPDQAAAVQQLFSNAQQTIRAGGEGRISGPEMTERMAGVATGIQDLLTGAERGIEVLTNPETKAALKGRFFEQAQEATNILAEEGASGEEVVRASDPNWLMENNPKLWGRAGTRLGERKTQARKDAAAKQIVRVGEGRQEPTKPMQNIAQREIFENTKMMIAMGRVRGRAQPWMFTLGGKIKQKVRGAIAQLDPNWVPKDEADKKRSMTLVKLDLERMFNLYRKLITGAQASVKEIEILRKTMPTTDMDWIDFSASMEQLHAEIGTKMRLAQKVLRGKEGIPVTSQELDADIDELLLMGDNGRTDKDVERRIVELQDQKKAPKDIIQQLAIEGYIDRERAQTMSRDIK
jgi:hypothetical protein